MLIIDSYENKIIEQINNLINQPNIDSKGFSQISPMYAFTSENIAGYLPMIELKDKSVLTISGSGDHIINSFLCGAKEVTAFDINILSAFITELKLAALTNFSYKEFLKFFMREDLTIKNKNPNAFDFKMYQGLKSSLSNSTRLFFEQLYKTNDYDGCKVRESIFFNNKYDNNELKIMSNLYLESEEQYQKAKERIKNKNIRWINCDIRDLASILENEKFDAILLSNISDYARSMFNECEDYLKQFFMTIIKPLYNLLSNKGVICSAYIYDAALGENRQYRSQIDNPKYRKGVFEQLNFNWEELYFRSVIPDKKDAVVLLK